MSSSYEFSISNYSQSNSVSLWGTKFPIFVYPPPSGSRAQIWLTSVRLFGSSFFWRALAARAQGGIHFRFVKSPSLTPAPQLPRGHATRLEAVKGRQTKKPDM